MGKVFLSRDQAAAIEKIKENANENWLQWFLTYKSVEAMKPLYYSSIDVIAKSLYVGYEIESKLPEFQFGDRIVNNNKKPLAGKKMIGTYHSYDPHFGLHNLQEFHGAFIGSDFRIATAEEEYWYGTLRREKVPHFLIEDIYVDKDGNGVSLGTQQHIDHANRTYANGDFQGIHPIESFKPFQKEN